MIYFTVDENGQESMWDCVPIRREFNMMPGMWDDMDEGEMVELPKGTIKRMTGIDLKWKDEPLEYELITNYKIQLKDIEAASDYVFRDKKKDKNRSFDKVLKTWKY